MKNLFTVFLLLISINTYSQGSNFDRQILSDFIVNTETNNKSAKY